MYCIIEQLNLMNSLTGENIIGFKNLRTGSYYLQYSFLQYQFHSTMENVSIAKSFLIGSWPEEDLQMEKCTRCDCTSSGFEIRILASSLKVTLSSRICIHHLYKLWPVRKWFSCKKNGLILWHLHRSLSQCSCSVPCGHLCEKADFLKKIL